MITGTIGNYLKNLGLQQKWQEKKNNNYAASPKVVTTSGIKQQTDSYVSAIESFLKEQEEYSCKIKSFLQDNQDCTRASVEFKMQYGGKLSSREIEYIRVNCPDLYAKALEREREREEYAKQLRNCKTKDDVFQFHMGKMTSFMSEVRQAEATGNYEASFEIRARLYNINEEYGEFINSKEYDELRCEREKREEVQEKKAAASQEENVNKEEDIKLPDEEEIQANENTSSNGQEQEQPGTNPNAATNKSKPEAAKHKRDSDKRQEVSTKENRIKSTVNKYIKNKPEAARENVDIKLEVPVTLNPDVQRNDVAELRGGISINI